MKGRYVPSHLAGIVIEERALTPTELSQKEATFSTIIIISPTQSKVAFNDESWPSTRKLSLNNHIS